MPRKKAAKDSVSTTYVDTDTLRKEEQQFKEARKKLAQERRLLAKERFHAIPRRGQFVMSEVMTLEEVAAVLRFTDTRVCERELRKRGVPIDEWPGGRKLVSTTLLIEKMEEYLRCLSEGMQA